MTTVAQTPTMNVMISSEDIAKRVKELGHEINAHYQNSDKELILVGLLRGSVLFMADLCRAIDKPHELDFMTASSYAKGTVSSGDVKILKDLDSSIAGKDVLIVEDIIDSGLTLSYLVDNIKSRQPASVRICTLLNKPERRKVDLEVNYNGFVVPDEFVVGYGLDYAEKYRNLPFIGILKPAIYA